MIYSLAIREISPRVNVKLFSHVLGEVSTNTQQHFALETQACMCVPTEDLMYVYPTSQYIHGTQKGVSHALGVSLNKV